MRIVTLRVRNFKRVKDVTVEPGATSLIIIGGKNEQGKSSVLDAITAAFSGRALPTEPVRHGAAEAEVFVELQSSNGDAPKVLSIRRRMPKGGKATLEVKSEDERLGSPQAVLNELIGERFLDPVEFARASQRTQRDMLVGLIDLPFDLGELEEERRKLFDRRTDVGQEARRWEGEAENIGELPPLPPEVTLTSLVKELNEAKDQERVRFDENAKLARMRADASAKDAQIKELKAQLASLEAQFLGLVDAGKTQAALCTRLNAEVYPVATLEEKLGDLEQQNTERTRLVQLVERKQDAEDRAAAQREEYTALSGEVEALDLKKSAALSEAELPLKGLDFDEEQVLYRKVPLKQASGAEQLQVSLAIAAALSPGLDDVWIRDGSLLDDDHVKAVAKWAKKKGARIWLERVGASDEGAIIIEEGEVVGNSG